MDVESRNISSAEARVFFTFHVFLFARFTMEQYSETQRDHSLEKMKKGDARRENKLCVPFILVPT